MGKKVIRKGIVIDMNLIIFIKSFSKKRRIIFSGILKNSILCEIVEIKNHPWMIGVQFHPEFKSKPLAPHPLFMDFIRAVIKNK